MSLIATPNGDGSFTIEVDFPYYVTKREAKYYQKRSQDQALHDAEAFASKHKGAEVIHQPQYPNYTVRWTEAR